MARATRKAQIELSAEQYDLIEEYAREQGRTVSSILRESLERTLLAALDKRRREAALQHLTSQELPVADSETIERELEKRWLDVGLVAEIERYAPDEALRRMK
jgi:hypothetical protein